MTNREEQACQKMIACGGWIIRAKKQVGVGKPIVDIIYNLDRALKASVAAVAILREENEKLNSI